MKNLLKRLAFVMALIMCISLSLPAMAQVGIYAVNGSGYGTTTSYIQVPDFKNSGTANEDYTIATGTVKVLGGGADTSATVTAVLDPLGHQVKDNGGNDVLSGTFKPEMAGKYTIIYSNGTSQVEMYAQIAGTVQGYTLSFPTNTTKIVPSKINPSIGTINLPSKTDVIVKDAEGNKITFNEADITITMTNDKGVATTALNGTTLTLDAAKDNVTYKVKYSYFQGGKLIATNNYTIFADKAYENDYEYTYTYDGTKPSTAEIGKETILPGVTATNSTTKENVPVHYTLKVTKGTTSYEMTGNTPYKVGAVDVLKLNEDGKYVFTPVEDGAYTVTYTIKNISNNAPTVGSTSIEISGVLDKTAPTPFVTLTGNNYGEVKAEEALVSKTENVNIMLLPIYADDNANDVYADNLQVLKRVIVNSNNVEVFNEKEANLATGSAEKVLVFNATSSWKNAEATAELTKVYVKGVAYSITKDKVIFVDTYKDANLTLANDSYKISYYAKDKTSGTAEVPATFDMVISATAPTGTPTVKFNTSTPLPTYMQKDEKVTFKAPTATDNNDSRLSSWISYTIKKTDNTTLTGHDNLRFDATGSVISFNEKTSEYTIDTSSIADIKQIIITANSQNDYNVTPASVSQTINVLGSTSAYTNATTITSTTAISANLEEGSKVTLPAVVYEDLDIANGDYLNVDVKIVSGTTEYDAYNVQYNYAGNSCTVKDGYFTPVKSGDFNITYTSTDATGKQTAIFFTVNIGADTSNLTADFKNLPIKIQSGDTVEVGTKLSLPKAEFYFSDADMLEVVNNAYTVSVIDSLGGRLDGKEFFTPTKTGDYKIKYSAVVTYKTDNGAVWNAGDEFDTIEKIYTFSVVDTVGPNINNKTELADAFYALNESGTVANNSTISLPLPTADDFSKIEVVIKTTNTEVTYDTSKAEDYAKIKSFRVGQNTSYTVTYKVYDENNTVSTLEYTFDVGDVIAPEIKVASGVVDKTYKVNGSTGIVIDMKDITATDIKADGTSKDLIVKNADGSYKIVEGSISITLKNTTTGATISSTKDYDKNALEFEFPAFTTAGTYELVVEVTDAQGQTATDKSISFTVTEDASDPLSSEEVLGIVLIVVSVLVLGGIITYFVVSRKNLEKKYK